jgi:FlaG/FlaF family flagellin (archaellin)
MRLIIHIAVVLAAALCATAYAQDTTVKSRTTIEADEAQVVSMTGCLRQDNATRTYSLVGRIAAAGEKIRTDSQVRVDVDKKDTTVTAETRAKGDKRSGADPDAISTYGLAPGNVNLTPYVGRQVQISAAAVKPGHKDADVTIDDKTTVDPERGRDRTERSKTKVEVERGPLGQYTVVSVRPLGGTCAAN